MTLATKKFLACVSRTGQRFGATHLIDVLRGSQQQRVFQNGHQDLDVYGLGKEFTVKQWKFLVRQFLQKRLLDKEEEFGVLKLNSNSLEILNNKEMVQGYPPPVETTMSGGGTDRTTASRYSPERYDQGLFEVLRRKRKELADKKNVPPYVIFPDKSLIEMSAVLPQTKEELSKIFGVGAKKLETYGDVFVQLIKAYADQTREKAQR